MKAKIYTKPSCPFCHKAKELLTKKGVEYEEIDVSENADLRAEISESVGGYKTVPMIFLDDEFIGGFTELQQKFQIEANLESGSQSCSLDGSGCAACE